MHRLVDVWATGEASAALGFEAARVFDQLDPLEKQKAEIMAARGISGGSVTDEGDARRCRRTPSSSCTASAVSSQDDPLVQYAILDCVANVLCPACKLWNTGHGAR